MPKFEKTSEEKCMSVKAIPDGYEGITPYLICKNAEAAIDFYKRAFGAEEIVRIGQPGMVGHAEMRIGNAIFMVAEGFPLLVVRGPGTIGGRRVRVCCIVEELE